MKHESKATQFSRCIIVVVSHPFQKPNLKWIWLSCSKRFIRHDMNLVCWRDLISTISSYRCHQSFHTICFSFGSEVDLSMELHDTSTWNYIILFSRLACLITPYERITQREIYLQKVRRPYSKRFPNSWRFYVGCEVRMLSNIVVFHHGSARLSPTLLW